VAARAGDGVLQHMARRGAEVLLGRKPIHAAALDRLIAGETLPDARFDPTRVLCALRDLFLRH